MFLSNTRRGNWFFSSDCQIYCGVAPLTLVKLLLVCLSMGGSFAPKESVNALVTVQTSERKISRAGKEGKLVVKRSVSWLLGEILPLMISQGIFPGAAFHSLSCFAATALTSIKRENMCRCSFWWIFSSACNSEALTMTWTCWLISPSFGRVASIIKSFKLREDRHPAIRLKTR